MANPLFIGSERFSVGGGFGSSISGSFNVGPDPVSIFALGVVMANSSNTRMDSLTLNPAGTPLVMTAFADRSVLAELGTQGRARAFQAIATGLTGVVNFTGLCTTLAGVSDGNGKPGVIFYWAKDVVSATSAPMTGPVSVVGAAVGSAPAIASATGNLVAGLWATDGTASTMSGSGGTTKQFDGFISDLQALTLTKPGAAPNVTLQALTTATSAFFGQVWNLVGAPVAPVITGPSGAATGPTQATIGVTSDTTGSISSLILPAATAAPADAATLIANGAAVVRTIAAAGTPQTFPITGLTTNAAVKVHWAMAGSNVQSSAAFTPNTLASSGTPAAQTAVAGGGITWAGATPQSFLTNAGNGSGAWSIVSSAGFSVAPSIDTSTGVLSGGTASGAGSYAPQVRYTDSSTVPGEQTVTFTLGLTVSASGDVTPPTLTSPAATGGALTCLGSVTTNEANGTLYTVFCASATPPTALQVEAGQDSASAAALRAVSQAVSATGSQSVVSGAITAGTRYAYFMHKDAAGNRSAVRASGIFAVTGPATYSLSCGPFGLNPGSGPVLGVAVSYTLTPGEVGAASGASINGTGTLHASTGLLAVTGLVAPGLYSVQIKNADGSGRWHNTATAA